jgi:hypothetical protein
MEGITKHARLTRKAAAAFERTPTHDYVNGHTIRGGKPSQVAGAS